MLLKIELLNTPVSLAAPAKLNKRFTHKILLRELRILYQSII